MYAEVKLSCSKPGKNIKILLSHVKDFCLKVWQMYLAINCLLLFSKTQKVSNLFLALV